MNRIRVLAAAALCAIGLPGLARAETVPFTDDSGLRLPVAWRGKSTLEGLARPFRVRVNWLGKHPESTRLFAIYVE